MIKKNKPSKTIFFSLVLSVLVSLLLSTLFACILASGIQKGIIKEEASDMPIILIHILSVFVACLVGINSYQEKKIVITGLVMAGYLFATAAVGIIFCKGEFTKIGSGIISVIVGGGAALGIKSIPPKKKKYTRGYNK